MASFTSILKFAAKEAVCCFAGIIASILVSEIMGTIWKGLEKKHMVHGYRFSDLSTKDCLRALCETGAAVTAHNWTANFMNHSILPQVNLTSK